MIMYTRNNSFQVDHNSYLDLEGLSDLFPSFLPEGLFDIFLHICQKETIHLEISLVCLFSYLILSSGYSVSTEMWPGSFSGGDLFTETVFNWLKLSGATYSILKENHVSRYRCRNWKSNYLISDWGMRRFHPLPFLSCGFTKRSF